MLAIVTIVVLCFRRLIAASDADLGMRGHPVLPGSFGRNPHESLKGKEERKK
jgi:hypothetical protein